MGRIAWHHTGICEDTTNEYWGDGWKSHSWCLLSRDSIRKCKQELCRWSGSAHSYSLYDGLEESSGSGSDDKSNRHIGPIFTLVFFSCVICCVCLRRGAQQCCQSLDEEKAMDVATPVGPNSNLWALTPKSISSSPTAKRIDKAQRAAMYSSKNKKTVVQPEPAAAAAAALSTRKYRPNLQFVEERQSGCPPDMVQTQGAALRHAAWVHTTPLRPPPPPHAVCPPAQLPTLLLQRPMQPSLRKKPPLQGVPPQEPTLVPSRKSCTKKHVTWDQGLGSA